MPYWRGWDGEFPSQAAIPLLVNLIILAAGISEAWKRHRIIGLTPLIMGVTFLLFNALFRNSGGRYILPVDWNSLLYYSIGLAQLSIGAVGFISGVRVPDRFLLENEKPPEEKERNLLHSSKCYIVAASFFLVGCAIPVSESSFPQLYPESRKSQMQTALMNSEDLSAEQRQDLQAFLSGGGAVYAGRALYPLYLAPTDNSPAEKSSPLASKPYPRVMFFLAGPGSNTDLEMPLAGKLSFFPNGSDVLVFRCPGQELLAIALFDKGGAPAGIIVRAPLPSSFSCPLPPVPGE
jgi:hypothetical protein